MTNTTLEYAAEYLRLVLAPLVSDVDSLMIIPSVDERGELLTIHSSKDDVGKIIGRKGDTLKALRRIVRQFGMNNSGGPIAVIIKDPRNEQQPSNN